MDLDTRASESFTRVGTILARVSCLASGNFADVMQSYVCGFTNVYAWIAGTCGVAIIISEGLLAMAIFYHSDYVPHVWHYFLVFQALNILCCIHNIFTLKRTLWLYDVACELLNFRGEIRLRG